MPASFHACGTEPTYQALVISWCRLLNRSSPPCFHASAGIPSHPDALPSFRPAIALAISSMVGISSRHVSVMRCGILSRALWYMSPGTLSNSWKCSHSILLQVSCCQRRYPFHLLISGEQVPSSWVPILPSVHCRSPSWFLSAALCSSTAFLSHQSDFSARVHFCSSLQAYLYAAVVDLVLLVCNTLWWAWSLLLIRVCSSWSFGLNQSWWFMCGLPRYVLAVLYTTCCQASHSSSGVELSFSSHWVRALSICSKLSLWLTVLSFAVLNLVGLLVLCLLCFYRILKATFALSIWWSVQQLAPRMALVLWMSILSQHLVMMKSIICQCLERGCIQVVLCSSFCLNMVFVTISSNSEHRASRSSSLELHSPIGPVSGSWYMAWLRATGAYWGV